MSGKQIPQESLREFGGQVDDWRRVGEETRMVRTLRTLVEEFDPEQVEVNGWVITFRDTSKVGTRRSGKSSGENSNSVSRRLFLNRKKEMVDRLANEQREAERWTERFAEAGRSSNASSKWVPPSKNTDLRRQVKSWRRYKERLAKEWRDLQEEEKLEPKIVDVIAEVETLEQELKQDKEEDKKIEDDDVMQGLMEAKEDLRDVSADEVEAAKDQRDVTEAKTAEALRDVSDSEEEEHVEKVSVQVVATGVSTRNRLREWRNESQILKDKAARKKNDEMQEAWRKKNDDFMKKCENKKNKKKTRRLKMRLHDKTIKGILSQTLF